MISLLEHHILYMYMYILKQRENKHKTDVCVCVCGFPLDFYICDKKNWLILINLIILKHYSSLSFFLFLIDMRAIASFHCGNAFVYFILEGVDRGWKAGTSLVMQSEVLELVDRFAISHLADYVLGLPAEWVVHIVVCEIGSQFNDAFGNTATVDSWKASMFPLYNENQFCLILPSEL